MGNVSSSGWNWDITTGIATVLTLFLAFVALLYTIWSGRKQDQRLAEQTKSLSDQTDLLRKRVFGELYSEAQIDHLCFILPEECKHRVVGFKQKENEEIDLGSYVAIPTGLERELHIRWQMSESQNIRGYSIGFQGDFRSKPLILGITRAFAKKRFQEFTREEYVDWHGDFHCEYTHHRRLPKDEHFVVAIKVRGFVEGSYNLRVAIAVEEAPKAWEGKLQVDCINQANDWARDRWDGQVNQS
jgi:hypothetical protein